MGGELEGLVSIGGSFDGSSDDNLEGLGPGYVDLLGISELKYVGIRESPAGEVFAVVFVDRIKLGVE